MDRENTPHDAYNEMKTAVDSGLLERKKFVDSLMTQFENKGSLSPKQIWWGYKLSDEANHEEDEPIDEDEEGDYIAIVEKLQSFTTRVKFNFDGVRLSPAPNHGKNGGSVYVKVGQYGDHRYAGKITPNGDYIAFGAPSDKARAHMVLDNINDIGFNAAVIESGLMTGVCVCCSRTLTDPASIGAGIGPVCAKKYGMGASTIGLLV
mgnify:CR=1 FL=1